MPTKAYAYVRVSGAGQVDKDGPDRQRAAIADFCARHGLILAREFFEAGVSGAKDCAARPELSRLFEQWDGHSVIVIEKLDRLARSLVVQEVILNRCLQLGVKVYAADNGTLTDVANCTDDPMRKLIRQFVGALAEFDRANIVMRTADARRRIRETEGRCEGRKPYGHTPFEAKILETILEQYDMSGSCAYVADYLNKAGLPTRTGGKWNKGTIHNMLKRTKKLVGQDMPLRIL